MFLDFEKKLIAALDQVEEIMSISSDKIEDTVGRIEKKVIEIDKEVSKQIDRATDVVQTASNQIDKVIEKGPKER